MPLKPLRPREVIRKLEKAGFALTRQKGRKSREICQSKSRRNCTDSPRRCASDGNSLDSQASWIVRKGMGRALIMIFDTLTLANSSTQSRPYSDKQATYPYAVGYVGTISDR